MLAIAPNTPAISELSHISVINKPWLVTVFQMFSLEAYLSTWSILATDRYGCVKTATGLRVAHTD